jgi:hypothetical protein
MSMDHYTSTCAQETPLDIVSLTPKKSPPDGEARGIIDRNVYFSASAAVEVEAPSLRWQIADVGNPTSSTAIEEGRVSGFP